MSTLKANRYENTASSSGGIDIDSSGNVGIATATTNGVLSVKTSASRQLDVETDSGDGNLVLKCTAPNSSNNLRNIDIAGQNVSFSTGAFDTTAHTERVRIDSTGAVKLLSGAGIDFSGIQSNASGMTSETLDSYEEGSFTPTLTGASGSPTHGTQSGNYVKIGRLVHCRIHMSITAKSTLSGALRISSLPFTVTNIDTSTSLDFSGVLTYFNNLSSTAYFISASPVGNSTTAALYFRGSTNLTDVLEAGDLDNDFDFRAHLIYYV